MAALILLVLSRVTSKGETGIDQIWDFGSFARDDLKAQSVKGACEQWLAGDMFDAKKILENYQIPKATAPYGDVTKCCWDQNPSIKNPELDSKASLWDVASTALKNNKQTVVAAAPGFIGCSQVCNAILNAYDSCRRRCPGQEGRVMLTCLNKILQSPKQRTICPASLLTVELTTSELGVSGCT